MRTPRDIIAANIRTVPAARGLKQGELAERAGLPQWFVCFVEDAKRDADPDDLLRLAFALDVRPEVITGRTLDEWLNRRTKVPA